MRRRRQQAIPPDRCFLGTFAPQYAAGAGRAFRGLGPVGRNGGERGRTVARVLGLRPTAFTYRGLGIDFCGRSIASVVRRSARLAKVEQGVQWGEHDREGRIATVQAAGRVPGEICNRPRHPPGDPEERVADHAGYFF